MYQQGGTIKDAVERIARNEWVLPAIQREFVWRPQQICALFDSVMQGYPFGELLIWRVQPEHSNRYRYYGFVRDYHERDNPHCPDLGILSNQQLAAVLDGQQRLTAFNIGLRGSMETKLPRLWWNNPDAFPRRVLALNLLAEGEQDEHGNRYVFQFIKDDTIGSDGNALWFPVSRVLQFTTGPDMSDWLHEQDLEAAEHKTAYRTLDRLHRAVTVDPSIFYYEETGQDLDRVLHIFIRRNSGGTVLSYSDLLLSIATAQWKDHDARQAVHGLVDELNQIGSGFDLSKDFVLKAGLMLTDIASVGFQVKNFTHDNMSVLEDKWSDIRRSLIAAVTLAASFGYGRENIRAESALLPIAYYIYCRKLPAEFAVLGQHRDDREAIAGWLARSFLKASGIWGSGLDTLLTALRETIRNEGGERFPVAAIEHVMARRGKSLRFESEELDEIVDLQYGDRRTFALLALLFPFVDLRNHFHVDHVFPAGRFSAGRLRKAGVAEDRIDMFRACANRLANLQLLEGPVNNEKRMKNPAEWLRSHFAPGERRHHCEVHELGQVPDEIADFENFYQARRKRLRSRVAALLMTK